MLQGLAAQLPTKNAWTLAEHAGEADPYGVQRLLDRASFDEDAALVELRPFVAAHLGAGDGVLVGDETGDIKKGSATVGVARQYTGTTGQVENAQVAVYLGYASTRGTR